MQRFCQRCVLEIPLDVQRCPHCGTLQSVSGISVRRVDSGSSWKRTLIILLIGLIGGGAVVGGYWYWKVKPRLQGLGVVAPTSKKIRGSLEIQEGSVGDFDRKLTLPVEPLGFAFGKDEFVLGNRKDPWGFVRLEPNEDKSTFDLTTVPVLETGEHATNVVQRNRVER